MWRVASVAQRCLRGGAARAPSRAAIAAAVGLSICIPEPCHSAASLHVQRRWATDDASDTGGSSSSVGLHSSSSDAASILDEEAGALESELASVLEGEGAMSLETALSRPLGKAELPSSSRVRLEKLDRAPARFDLLTNSLAYRWQTTAVNARKVCGPMREWATELKYRTGCHVETEPTYPERLLRTAAEGGYATADEVDMTVYLFGSERGIFNCHRLMETIVDLEPAYVRLGAFRRVPADDSRRHPTEASAHGESSASAARQDSAAGGGEEVEWLMLRRINRELRPPDIPPISLKLPGKWTLLYEDYKEAAIRTLWEETGITVDPSHVYPTARLTQSNPAFYWRVPVHYFVVEVPYDVPVLGPQVVHNAYMRQWDARLLRQSPDPMDRAWAASADPETGCGWMKAPLIDELQRPLRGEDYMAVRYTPPPYSGLGKLLGFEEMSPVTPSGGDAAAPAVHSSEGTSGGASAPPPPAPSASAAEERAGGSRDAADHVSDQTVERVNEATSSVADAEGTAVNKETTSSTQES